MSLEQHSIDKAYDARLSGLEVAPPVHAWAAIAAQLPNEKADEKGFWFWGSGSASTLTPEEKSKRDRKLLWWWSGALLALAGLSLLAYYGLHTSSTSNTPTPNPQSSSAALLPIALNADQEFKESSNFNSVINGEEDCPETSAISSQDVARPNAQAHASTTIGSIPKTSSLPSNFQAKNSPQNLIEKNSTTSTSLITAPSSPKGSQLQVAKLPEPPSRINTVGLSIASVALDNLPSNNLLEFESSLPALSALPSGPGLGCEDFKNSRGWTFAVRAFAGPGTVIQDFKSSDQNEAYQALRDSVEMDQLSVHAGLRFEAVNDFGLFLRAGADYQLYRTNVVSLGPPSSRTIIDSVFMEDTGTWRVETRNEVFQEQRDVYNRQHSVALTAGVGYRPTFGNVSPYIMVEAGYEFLFKNRGTFVLPDGNFADLADDDDGLYINDRPGLQYGGVIGVDFALTSQIEVGISGHYKRLGGLRGSADLLDFDQSTAFGALNLRYTIGGF